jgi:hypothetical protein
MNLLSSRRPSPLRNVHLGKAAITAASLIVVACSGATTQVGAPVSGDQDSGSPSTSGSGGSSGGSGSGGTTSSGSSSGAGAGSSSGSPGSSSGGTGSSSGSSGSSSGTVAHGDGGACSATGTEVVMIGDSYPALSGEIGKHLMSLASAAGSLASGDKYRTYYVSGTNLVGGNPPSIPDQFTQAVMASPDIKYVIMDGGGNDILLDNPQCITTQPPPQSATCVTVINNAITAATTLFGTMKTAGVKAVVYYFYPHLPTTGKQYVNQTMDYAYPLVQMACASAPLPVYFVDTRAAFDGHPEYIGPDGIHPTTAGSDVIAGLIWGVMQQQCIAQ